MLARAATLPVHLPLRACLVHQSNPAVEGDAMPDRLVMIVLGENCRRVQGPTGPPFVTTLIADSQMAKGEATFLRVVLAGFAHLQLENPGIQLHVLPLSGKATPMFDPVTM